VKRSDGYLAPVIAPLPPSLQERCLAAPGLLAHLIVAKFCDHLPLYRLESIFAQRHGPVGKWLEARAKECNFLNDY
jgi:transposase